VHGRHWLVVESLGEVEIVLQMLFAAQQDWPMCLAANFMAH
jgi:hypothetical protein